MKERTELDFAIDIAQEAGNILKKYHGSKLTKTAKTFPGDFATEADLESEQLIISAIQAQYPADSIVAEESGKHEKENSEHTWIIDPLDGTHNFVRNEGKFGVFIARARGKKIELAMAFDPIQDMSATAIRGQGTVVNGAKIKLDNTDPHLPLSTNEELGDHLKSLGQRDSDRSAIGSTLSALAGKAKAYVVNVGFVWDFAVPALLFAEAGWKVTDFQGNEYSWDDKIEFGHPGIVAAPKELHARIMNALNTVK